MAEFILIYSFSISDINKNALTFRSRGTFVEANATSKIDAHKFGLFRFFSEDILLNIRTFDVSSLILYAYDYMNNFVQLHTDQNNKVVFTFNSEDIIQQVATNLEGLFTNILLTFFFSMMFFHNIDSETYYNYIKLIHS